MCIVGRSDLSSPLAEVTGLNCLNSMQLQAGRAGGWGVGGGKEAQTKTLENRNIFLRVFASVE